jgi:hypothetical protein
MVKRMKLLILILLAFAGYAHAQNKTFQLEDGTTTSIKGPSTELVARSFSVGSDKAVFEYVVYTCYKGQGLMEVWIPSESNGVYVRTFGSRRNWVKDGSDTVSKIATHICDLAINKAIK